MPPASGDRASAARGTALLEDLGNLTANELYDPAGAGDAAPAILQGLDALPRSAKTSSLSPTRCSAAARTMPGHRPLSAGAGTGEQRPCRPGRRRGAGGVRHPCLL